MIRIKPSPTADTRTCDWSKVTREQLYVSSVAHLADVRAGMALFAEMVRQSGERHDFDKLTAINHFHWDFQGGFKETGWWDNHRKINRHHLAQEDGVPGDVNLIDVLEFITDCVMAGLARSGSVYPLALPPALLERAFQNTVELLKAEVTVERPAPVEVECTCGLGNEGHEFQGTYCTGPIRPAETPKPAPAPAPEAKGDAE